MMVNTRMESQELINQLSEEKRPYLGVVEALIFSSDSPLPVAKIREIVPTLSAREVRQMIEILNARYGETGQSFRINEIAGGYRMFTLPEFAPYVEKLYENKQKNRLTAKALETLAIIAYKQPVTRGEIEEIRGVNVDGVVRTLLSRNLITIAGRAQTPGSPFLYKTTRKFLDYFGLNSLDDLPRLKEIDDLIEVEDRTSPYRDTVLKEISPGVLGLKITLNGEKELIKRRSNGGKKQ